MQRFCHRWYSSVVYYTPRARRLVGLARRYHEYNRSHSYSYFDMKYEVLGKETIVRVSVAVLRVASRQA